MNPARPIRRIRGGDGPRLRAIRLAALRTDPAAFASSYAQEESRSIETWETTAALASAGSDQGFFVAEENDRFVGMAGAYRPERQPRTMHLIAMWVEPEARRRGIGLALTNAVIDWAKSVDVDEVTLWVVDGQEEARRIYERAGFTITDIRQPVPEDPDRIETLMRLPLGGRMNLPPGYVEFAPMTTPEFETYLQVVLSNHAADLMEEGSMRLETAQRRAYRSITGMLPNGVVSPGMHLATIREGLADAPVGWIWFGTGETPQGPVTFLYDLSIFANHRDRGMGSAALEELEEWASGRTTAVVVTLFAHQSRARQFFERNGYVLVTTEGGRPIFHKRL